jgi:hypothetical protein
MRTACVSALLAVATVLGAGCGKGNNGQSNGTPTGPSSTAITSIAVNSSGPTLTVGNTETFTATATLGSGSTQPLSGGVWGLDALTVASVGGSTGAVKGLTAGAVTVFVDAQGVRGTKLINVVPNYQGQWAGTYTVNDCADSEDFHTGGLCALFTPGAQPSAGFQLTQNGKTVTGVAVLGQVSSSLFSASIGGDGSLTFSVNAVVQTTTVAQSWSINVPTPGQMTGTLHQEWSDSVAAGHATINAAITGITLVSAQPTRAAGGRPTLLPDGVPQRWTRFR